MPHHAQDPRTPGPAPGSTPAPPAPPASPAAPAVLIVDDNPQNLELLEAYFEDSPYAARALSDPSQVLASLHAQRPDAILLDIMMPRVSGFQLCQQIKRDPALRAIPVLMVTALSEVSDAQRAADAGADAFITKPVTKKELLSQVHAALVKSGRVQA
ncbi:MAG: two-component system response regulator [Planctomyces sp.]|nr:two-component system response regulator [Planctomyces sp.]